MAEFGRLVGEACLDGGVIYLDATLGMGKTTLSRAIVQGLGWQDRVKSPTYTLVEAYETANLHIHHFDLYRLADPEELEYLGIRDLDEARSLWLVEWPEKGAGVLPPADITVIISSEDIAVSRQIELIGHSERGKKQIQKLEQTAGSLI